MKNIEKLLDVSAFVDSMIRMDIGQELGKISVKNEFEYFATETFEWCLCPTLSLHRSAIVYVSRACVAFDKILGSSGCHFDIIVKQWHNVQFYLFNDILAIPD